MKKFVNNNRFPIALPDGRGGMCTIKPGEGFFNSWFSRFVGPKRLSVIEVSVDKPTQDMIRENARQKKINEQLVQRRKQRAPIFSAKSGAKPTIESLDSMKDKETKDYLLRQGIYQCKHCELYRTGSLAALKSHLSEFHECAEGPITVSTRPTVIPKQLPSEDEEVGINGALKDKTVQQVIEETEQKLSQQPFIDKRTPITSTDTLPDAQTNTGITPESSSNFECDVPGCGKAFTSKRGLNLHLKKAHNRDTK